MSSDPTLYGRSFGAEENINGGCHWSCALNLRHGEERLIHINKNHVCFSLIDHQLKKSIIVLFCLPSGKNAYSFSAELYVNKFMKISWLSEVGLTLFLILKSNVLQ